MASRGQVSPDFFLAAMLATSNLSVATSIPLHRLGLGLGIKQSAILFAMMLQAT